MADMYPAFDYGNLIKEELKRKEKIGGYDINESAISDFADPNYEPISILDQFADPDYVSESIQDKIAKEVPMEQQLSISELMLNAKAKDSKQLRESKALSKYAADLNKKDKAAKAKAEKEKFVPRDTLLGRIFDKRVRPGEEISNRDKSSAILRNISDNLMESRLVGGKEGTDTLSRILGPSGGIREGLDEIKTLETASKSKKAAAVDRALALKKKQLDYDTGLANIAKTYYDMSGNADATTLQKNAEYAAQMAVSSGQILPEDAAAFISQYLRLDQIGANVLASQLDSLQEQLFTADPDEQEAIKQQIADINNQIQIRGSGQSTGTTTSNDIPYGSLLE
jgi:hypothetical protein